MNYKTILVIEDEKPLLEAIDIKLKKSGFEVVTARTVEQAKNYAQDINQIDAIWLDHYLMGKENGLDFVVWCKEESNEKFKKIPIFVVSNTATPDKVASYMSLGVNDYYVKANFRLDEIIDNITKKVFGVV
jgi:DNA-binding response OmpR family regulator